MINRVNNRADTEPAWRARRLHKADLAVGGMQLTSIQPRDAFENMYGQYFRDLGGTFSPPPQLFGWLSIDLVLPVSDPDVFTSVYSNAMAVDMAVQDLADILSDYPEYFETLFVGVVPSSLTTSEAVSRDKLCGDLIILEAGLRDAVALWAVAFYEYLLSYEDLYDERYANGHNVYIDNLLAVYRDTRARDGDMRRDAVERFLVASQLFDAHTFVEDDKKELAYTISPNSDRFIVAHEMCHHLLNHTGPREGGHNAFAQAIESIPAPQGVWLSDSNLHDREFLADHVSIDLVVGGGPYSPGPMRKEETLGAIMGACATLSTLSCLSGNPYEDALSHPAPVRRFDSVHALCCAKNTAFGITNMMGAKDAEDEQLFHDIKRMLAHVLNFNDTLNGRRKELGEFTV